MEKPLISVIMGVYNPPSYNVLKRAIDSVLNQTYENIEFIICDDGSNVETKQWLDEIVQTDQRIKCIDNSANIGLAATLNRCIQISKGKYIARQDADDYSDKTRFDKQIDFLEKNPQLLLNTVRAFVLKKRYNMCFSERLVRIIKREKELNKNFIKDLLDIQKERYGKEIMCKSEIQQIVETY